MMLIAILNWKPAAMTIVMIARRSKENSYELDQADLCNFPIAYSSS